MWAMRGGKALAIIIIFASGLFLGRYIWPAKELYTAGGSNNQIISPIYREVWDKLHDKYINGLDDQRLRYGAIEGMVRAAGDPYTIFSTPEDTKQLEETLSGSFSGVGIEIGVRNGLVTVIAPLEGSPAKSAGVQSGDTIVAIDDQPVTPDMTLDQIVQRIRGPKGTTVKLTVVHQESREGSDVTITRDTIEVESVKLAIEEGLAHLTITNFAEDTDSRFAAAIRQIIKEGARGVILDLRSNPGGFLQGAVDISSYFLPEDSVVVIERGKQTREYKSDGNHVLKDIPVVVLVDGGSASASEIVAGAIKDHRGVPVIGTKTFGKGSVQELIELDDGSSVRVTIARWFTPHGESIDKEGITPTTEVKNDPDTEEDEQFIKAKEELNKLIK